jgi:hypothetical protein
MTARIWTASSVAIGILVMVIGLAFAETSTPQKPTADDKNWQAVAPGLVEPRSGPKSVGGCGRRTAGRADCSASIKR